jgi:hypothetical protein
LTFELLHLQFVIELAFNVFHGLLLQNLQFLLIDSYHLAHLFHLLLKSAVGQSRLLELCLCCLELTLQELHQFLFLLHCQLQRVHFADYFADLTTLAVCQVRKSRNFLISFSQFRCQSANLNFCFSQIRAQAFAALFQLNHIQLLALFLLIRLVQFLVALDFSLDDLH